MAYTDKDRVSALSGIFQSASLVHSLATTGQVDDTLFENSINSLFVLNPQKIADIYSHRALMTGTGLLKKVLTRKIGTAEQHILRYVLNLVQLEARLQKDSAMQDFIRQRIEQAARQKTHFEQMNGPIALNNILIANLASIYKESISTLAPRVQVLGQPQYLQAEINADKIRTLLLAGIRSALLWRQVGGRRWHLFFSRGRMLNVINTQFDAGL